MTKINHGLKILTIVVSISLIGFFLDSYNRDSILLNEYFEIASGILPIVFSFSIFVMTWLAYKKSDDDHSLYLGITFLIIGILGLFHILSYPSMPDFITPNDHMKETIFKIEAMIISSILFFISTFIYKNSFHSLINRSLLINSAFVLLVLSLTIVLFYPRFLPVISNPDGSLSATSIFLILITSLILLYTGYLYYKKLEKYRTKSLVCFNYGFIIIAISNPVQMYYEISGHLLLAAGFYFIYYGLYKVSIEQPYEKRIKEHDELRYTAEERYRSLFDNANDAIVIHDLGERVLSWNRSAEKIFGWNENEVIGKRVSQLMVPPDIEEERNQMVRNALLGDIITGVDTVRFRKDGSKVNVSLTISPLRNKKGVVIGFSSILRDISERKKTEKALKLSEEKYRTMIEHSNDMIWTLDNNGKFKYFNKIAEEVTGYTLEDWKGKSFAPMIHPEALPVIEQIFHETLSGKSRQYEVRVYKKDGSLVVLSVNTAPVVESGEYIGTVSFARDITEKKKAEEEINIRNQMALAFLTTAHDKLYSKVLHIIRNFTGSMNALFGYINEKEELVFLSYDNEANGSKDISEKKIKFPRDKWTGVWGEALNKKITIYSNEPQEVPEGHLKISNVIAASIIYQGELVGEILVGNKKTDFDEKDRYLLEKIVDYITPILHYRLNTERKEKERKVAEKALMESEKKFRSTVESAIDAIVLADESGKIILWNKSAENIFGWKEKEALNKPITILMPEKYKNDHMTILEKLRSTDKSKNIKRIVELEGMRKNGNKFPLEISLAGWNSGNKIFYCGIIRDITERKESEDAIRRSNEFSKTVLDSMNDAISIIDVNNYKIIGVNSVFLDEFGNDENDLIGETCFKITHNRSDPCQPPNDICPLQETIKNGKHSIAEHIHFDKDGKKMYVEVTASPIRDEKGRITQVVHRSRDITDRKLAEENLKKANDELKKADKLKTQFLSVVSHELRTPLTPMKAQLQMILAGYFGEITEKQVNSLEMILRNTNRQDRLVCDILDISKLESGVMKFIMEKGSLPDIIENAVKTMKPQALEKNISLSLRQDDIPEIIFDRDRITQVVVNLLNNALKFTDNGGTISIELSGNTDHATIKIRDSGIGISKKDQKRIFRPFEQVDSSMSRKFEGSGLGLTICKGIIESHGGTIFVESEPGMGSTFQFTISYNNKITEDKVKEARFKI